MTDRPVENQVRCFLRLLAAVAAFAVVLAPWWFSRDLARGAFPGFVIASASLPVDAQPFLLSEEINPSSSEAKAHSGALAEMPDGTLAVAWYAGSGEGAKDVTIQFSTRGNDGKWCSPRTIFDRAAVSAVMDRYVLSLGNPLLLPESDGRLGLLFVSIAAGKWSGSSINYTLSNDGGATWSNPQKLTLNPLANLSALPRNPPAALADGGWVVPIYEEFLGRFPEMLWLRAQDPVSTAAVSRMDDGMSVFQPSVVPLSANDALAFYRDDSGSGRVMISESSDAGKTWSKGEPSTLPNFDSGVCALRLADGRLICAFNDSTSRKRENLRLAVSDDKGKSWRTFATLAEERGENFAYPYMVLGRDGRVRMVYSARDTRIVYAEFNAAWIDAQTAKAGEGAL
jgi:predicted neuraminidase